MPQDAAASGAKSDADSTAKGDSTTDAGSTGDQPDVEKIVAARVGQALRKYGDLDDLKTKAAEFDKLKESQKTETEKLTDRIATLEREKVEDAVKSRDTYIRALTIEAAARLGYGKPKIAHALLRDEGTEVTEENVEQVVADLLKANPELSSSRVNGSADGGTKGKPTDTTPTMNELLRAAAGG